MYVHSMSQCTSGCSLASCGTTVFEELTFPLTRESLACVLREGALPHGRYSHLQIVDWCQRFYLAWGEQPTEDSTSELPDWIEIAVAVDAQWELYLASTYSLTQLQNMDFSKVRLPDHWFTEWLAKIERASCVREV